MTEPSLELLFEQNRRIIEELVDIREKLREMHSTLERMEQDMRSLARVMLRFETRINTLEEARIR